MYTEYKLLYCFIKHLRCSSKYKKYNLKSFKGYLDFILDIMAKSNVNKGKGRSAEEIFAGFQNLRSEQRLLANKISELEMDLNEHKIVIETLQTVDKTRKCFRMVGGVLVERTVGEVLPELENNRERLPKAIQALNEQLARKGQEINEYIETHDIKVQRTDRPPDAAPEQPAKSNVLVASG